MDTGIKPPLLHPLTEGGEDTVGWRRAQLSALINHTGQITPLPLLHYPPPPPFCVELKHSAGCKTQSSLSQSFTTVLKTSLRFVVGQRVACVAAVLQEEYEVKGIRVTPSLWCPQTGFVQVHRYFLYERASLFILFNLGACFFKYDYCLHFDINIFNTTKNSSKGFLNIKLTPIFFFTSFKKKQFVSWYAFILRNQFMKAMKKW